MLGRITLAADVTLTAPTDFDTAQLAAGQLMLGFQVEEAEMLVDLEARITYSHTTDAAPSDFTFYVDGAASADLPAAGLVRHTPAAATDENTVYMRVTLRLPQGYHTVDVRATTAANNIIFEGASLPSTLVVRRHSHPATLGHGVDSKVQLVQ